LQDVQEGFPPERFCLARNKPLLFLKSELIEAQHAERRDDVNA